MPGADDGRLNGDQGLYDELLAFGGVGIWGVLLGFLGGWDLGVLRSQGVLGRLGFLCLAYYYFLFLFFKLAFDFGVLEVVLYFFGFLGLFGLFLAPGFTKHFCL